MEYLSMFIYLVRSCWIGLWIMLMVDLLSQYNFIASLLLIIKLSMIIFSHNTSQISGAIAMNSFSTWSSNYGLLFISSCHKITSCEHAIIYSGSSINRVILYNLCLYKLLVLIHHLLGDNNSLPGVAFGYWNTL